MSHSSVLERSKTSQSTQSLSVYGLGGEFSYTQTVVSELIDMIETWNKKGKKKSYDIKRVMTDTNPWAIKSINGAALSVVPIANDTGKMVAENCLTVDKILKMWDNLNLMWWYSLEVKHILACLEGDSIENLASLHSHPQVFLQCVPSLQKNFWQKESVEIPNSENPEELEKVWFNIETDLFVCSVKDWKNFEGAWYYLVESEFHSKKEEDKKGHDRYHLISWWIDQTEAKRVLGTSQALQRCRRKIWELSPIRLIEESSTTAHLDNWNLRRGQWIITGHKAIEHYRELMGLKVLDWDFWPKNNFTHFAVFSNSKQEIPGLNLKQWWWISTIELLDAQREKEIREILQKSWIDILFEKVEERENSDLFTGVLDLTKVKWPRVKSCMRQINSNGIGWRMELMSPE